MLKYFHNEFIGSVASNYHENNKVKDFLANFWSGCLSDFTKLPRVSVGSSKTLMEKFIS